MDLLPAPPGRHGDVVVDGVGSKVDVHFVSPAPVSSPRSAGLQPGSRSHAGAWRSQGKPRRTGSGFMKQTCSLPARRRPSGSTHCKSRSRSARFQSSFCLLTLPCPPSLHGSTLSPSPTPSIPVSRSTPLFHCHPPPCLRACGHRGRTDLCTSGEPTLEAQAERRLEAARCSSWLGASAAAPPHM